MGKMNLLELRFSPIEGQQHHFKVSMESCLSGEVDTKAVLPFLDAEDSNIDRRFTIVKILELTHFKVEIFDESERDWMVRESLLLPDQSAFKPRHLAMIGRKLYQILGRGVQQAIETAVGEAKRDGTWLHIRLRFPENDTKYSRLTDYPWELLYNDYGFLADQGVAFSRYIAYGSPPANLPTVERLNVLLISSGTGDERMKLDPLPEHERKAILSGLQEAEEEGKIKLEILPTPTLKVLRKRLQQRQNEAILHVLHFDGHGFFGKRCNECRKAYIKSAIKCECGAPLGEAQGYLVFENSDGSAHYVSAREISELLGNSQRREQPNSESGIALVVLSSCRSGMSSKGESVFNGVAQSLISRGIPGVVAMTYSIGVDAAAEFAESFYLSLGEKDSLVVAFRQAQSAIGIEGNQWYRPVLYLRWADNQGGQLFKVNNSPSTSSPVSKLNSEQTLDSTQLSSSLLNELRKSPDSEKLSELHSLTSKYKRGEEDPRNQASINASTLVALRKQVWAEEAKNAVIAKFPDLLDSPNNVKLLYENICSYLEWLRNGLAEGNPYCPLDKVVTPSNDLNVFHYRTAFNYLQNKRDIGDLTKPEAEFLEVYLDDLISKL